MRQYNDKWFLREFRLAQQQHNTDNNNDFIFQQSVIKDDYFIKLK